MKKIMTRLLSLVLLGAFIPSFVLAETWDLGKGDITVTATETSQTVSQVNGETKDDPDPVITSNGKTENTVIINAGENATANVTLENVNIDVSSKSEAAITTQGQGDVTLNLSGNNSVQSGIYHAGVHKENTGNLTVTAPEGGTGSLNATGGQGGAGIGGDSSGGNGNNITISGGTVVAKGGEYSAGIGGGGNSSHKDASKITISGGDVKATGAGSAAGIGGGNGGSGTDIEITGGKVTATGGEQGAGIGGGNGGNGSRITVSGGEVNAAGKDNYDGGGAGIGGGSGGNGSDITVSKGIVNATGGNYSAGIGGGKNGSGSNIAIEGGKVKAIRGSLGAGIGGGKDGSGSNIAIEGGKVEASSVGGGAGIGGGSLGSGSNIAVSGGEVTAQGGVGGAGIGGGQGGSGSKITISDGKVTATGAGAGAGIGGGYAGSGEGITIEGGEVTAQGDAGGAGIGGGISGTGSDVTISGDAQVKVQGGTTGRDWHKGAAIGNGGTPTTDGNEVSPNTSDLKVGGFIQIYEPGKNINTDTPDRTIEGQKGDHSWNAGEVTTPATCTTPGVRTYTCTKNPAHTKTEPIPALNHLFGTYIYNNDATCTQDGTETAKCERCNETDTRTKAGTKLTEHTPETVPESKAAAYWVSDPEGQSIPYQAQQKDGVLTVTVQADTASLRGTTGSLGQLEAQGITGIRFVTNGAQSAFTLSDLLTSGTGSFTLTHDGDKVTFTLESTDISGILK